MSQRPAKYFAYNDWLIGESTLSVHSGILAAVIPSIPCMHATRTARLPWL